MSKQIFYTICPVGNSTYLAANNGFLKEALENIGYEPVLLQSLDKKEWPAHFTYENDRLFRDGGNVPPIWAKSKGKEIVLLGLNIIEEKQSILVRADSDIEKISDLKGKRLAIPVHATVHIDFHQATAQQGFENALLANGIDKKDVVWKQIVTEEGFGLEGRGGSYGSLPGGATKSSLDAVEIEALENGEVDAVFGKLPRTERLIQSGKFRKIYDVAYDQRSVTPVNNEYPGILTVSRKLVEEEPEVVQEFVRQSVLAARWAKTHQKEAEELLAKQTNGTVAEFRSAFAEDFYQRLEPNFSEEGLKALENRVRFLYDHGYLEKTVDVYEWADRSFLAASL